MLRTNYIKDLERGNRVPHPTPSRKSIDESARKVIPVIFRFEIG